MNYLDLARLAAAEILLVVTALVVLSVDLGLRQCDDLARRTRWAVALGVAGCVSAVVILWELVPEGAMPAGMFASDALTRGVKAGVLLLTAGSLLLSRGIRFTPHVGEYVATVILGAVGMLLIVSSENVLILFLALELASLCLYILTGFDKRSAQGTEAALKYFLFGGMAGAVLLFGLSLVYGATGAIEFGKIAQGVAESGVSPVLLMGLVMVMVGLGFKVASAPFHFWAPDAYQAAPTPAAGFIAAGSKVASFFILAKLAESAFGPAMGSSAWGRFAPGWSPVLATMAAMSMVWGNLAALMQTNVKRLLAYSAVAHAGYTLVAIAAGGPEGLSAVTFYAVTYAITTLGAFGVVGLVESATGGAELDHFAGLVKRSPRLAVCLGIFVLSLAGIPPLAGFFGKFYLFLVALDGSVGSLGLLWLVALGAATTCVSFYYYLVLLKKVFVEDAVMPERAAPGTGVESAVVWASTILVVLLGCFPGWILTPLRSALMAVGW
ncbi:MAG: NADH-quinone oxidoreductase subunit N [Verrucomicrobiales bacterium]|nr:NADH-quinone oxidoreductase subunit N [Verrucomicrobiales bacterium]